MSRSRLYGKGTRTNCYNPQSPLKFKPNHPRPPPFSFLSLFTLEFHARSEITISLFHGSQFHGSRKDINLPSDCTHPPPLPLLAHFPPHFPPLPISAGSGRIPAKCEPSISRGCNRRIPDVATDPNKCRLSLTIGEGGGGR